MDTVGVMEMQEQEMAAVISGIEELVRTEDEGSGEVVPIAELGRAEAGESGAAGDGAGGDGADGGAAGGDGGGDPAAADGDGGREGSGGALRQVRFDTPLDDYGGGAAA
eukprot:4851650-Prymnesium_polylepis.1